jgi:hypothetical protein
MKINGYLVFNAIGLVLLGGFAALFAIQEQVGLAECRNAEFGVIADGRFWQIHPMVWPVLSALSLALAGLSFTHVVPKAMRVAPFIPTAMALLCIVLGASHFVDFGTRFVNCGAG